MSSKKEFFDPEFENELTNIRIDELSERVRTLQNGFYVAIAIIAIAMSAVWYNL